MIFKLAQTYSGISEQESCVQCVHAKLKWTVKHQKNDCDSPVSAILEVSSKEFRWYKHNAANSSIQMSIRPN